MNTPILETEDCPVGYIKVSMDDSYDLGYGLYKEYWHKGIITEADGQFWCN